MMRSRWVGGIAVLTAVAVGGVGGALIGVPGSVGRATVPRRGHHRGDRRASRPPVSPAP